MINRIMTRLSMTWQVLRTGKVRQWGERQIPPITLEEVAEVKAFFPMEKYFIFGHARSGTTLLMRLVRLHPEVHCNYQAHFFTRPPLLSGILAGGEFEEWFSRRSNRWNQGKDLSSIALRAMADFIMERGARREGKIIVGDKSPNVILNGKAVSEMHTFYPEARLIYIVRDGRDTLVSHLFQNFINAAKHLPKSQLALRDEFARNPEPFMNGEKSIFTEETIRRMASGWVKNVEETDRLGREIYQDRYHFLRYEDMLRAPHETMQQIWAFLGATPMDLTDVVAAEMTQNPDAAYQKEVANDLVKNLDKGKRGSWRELLTERDKRIFKEIAGETLIAWVMKKIWSGKQMKFMVAGLGSIGRRHLRHLKALGETDVLLYRTHQATLPDEDLSGLPVETDLEAALASRPDAVIVSNPTALHLDVAIPAAEQGCHILLEKPISHNLDGVDRLKQAAEKSGSRILVGFQFRYHPGLQKIVEVLSSGEIGRPVSFRAHWGEYLPNWHPWEDYRASYSARKDLGGGVILTLTHPLDYLHWMFGPLDALWSFNGQLSDLDLEVVDTAEIGLQFINGVIGSVHLNYVQRPPRHQLEIVCTGGTIRWDNAGTGVEVYRAEDELWAFHPLPEGFERDDLFRQQMEHFLRVVKGTDLPRCTLDDGIAALQAALAAHQSSSEGILWRQQQ